MRSPPASHIVGKKSTLETGASITVPGFNTALIYQQSDVLKFDRGKSQSDLVIGTNGPRRWDPEYMSAALGNSILGQFGMMGRIGDVVREKSGLAYYAYSSLSTGIGPGSWEVCAGVNPQNVPRARQLILDELDRYVQEGVTEDELVDSKANFIGRLPLSLESSSGVANALLNIERHQLGLDYYRRYPNLVSAVTREDVLSTARKFINLNRLAIAAEQGPKGPSATNVQIA